MARESERRLAKDALFDGFARIAAALASGRRAEIVEVLAQGERTVEEVAEAIDQSVANTSHHLRKLAAAGLLATRRRGTYVYYRLASQEVLELWLRLRRLAAGHLDELAQLADAYLGDRDHLETVTMEELRRRLATGEVTLVDVRPASEYAAGHIPGAVSVPPEELDRLLAIIPADAEVVAYCRGPYCVFADDAVRFLRSHGRPARRLLEGVPEWRQMGGPVAVGTEGEGREG